MPLLRCTLRALIVLLIQAQPSWAQWILQSSGMDAELRGLNVVSSEIVWASGVRGSVVRTIDGGRRWRTNNIPGASALDLRAVAATSARVAHAMSIGDSSRIFRTIDGGLTWSLRYTSTRKGSFFDAIRFWDERHGIAVSDPVDGRFLLITTHDGGESWQDVPLDALPPALPNEGAFAASGSCLAVYGRSDVWFVTGGAARARLFHSTDRGRSWTVSDTPLRAGVAAAGAFSVAFRDAKHGVVVGGDYQQPKLRGGNAALTSDGGMTWTVVDSATSPVGYRSAVAFVPGFAGKRLIAVGLSGTDTSSDGGRTWTVMDTTAYNSVQFSVTAGYAVGPKGRVAKYVVRR